MECREVFGPLRKYCSPSYTGPEVEQRLNLGLSINSEWALASVAALSDRADAISRSFQYFEMPPGAELTSIGKPAITNFEFGPPPHRDRPSLILL
jgi:hypothetical protein